ncbi:hypothetical protein PR003_g18448 [Phytophthora rubi]|nr:hypothetical protein PR001_g15887 [Phytophthora rubi]KAE9317556.1 hypothetical protein PR003_g18448 [Phytophthora rubi]
MTKGVLLTDPEMDEASCIHSELKAMQAADQEYRSLRRYTYKLDLQALKRGTAGRELVERRAMRMEGVAAHSIRRTAQRTNTATPKARTKAKTQQANEAQ